MNTFKTLTRCLSAGAFTLVVTACADRAPAPSAIEQLADEYLAELKESDALMGTYYSIEDSRHDRLPDNSLAAMAAWEAKEDAWLAELARIGAPADIGSRDWVTHGLLKEQLESAVSTRICRDELWAASTTTSWHTWIPFVYDIQPLATPELRAQALTRLAAMDTYIDNEINNLREGLQLLHHVLRQLLASVVREHDEADARALERQRFVLHLKRKKGAQKRGDVYIGEEETGVDVRIDRREEA